MGAKVRLSRQLTHKRLATSVITGAGKLFADGQNGLFGTKVAVFCPYDGKKAYICKEFFTLLN